MIHRIKPGKTMIEYLFGPVNPVNPVKSKINLNYIKTQEKANETEECYPHYQARIPDFILLYSGLILCYRGKKQSS